MHGHFPGAQGLQQYGEAFGDRLLFLNVACGVTTVRGMIGGPRDLRVREEVARGVRLGPQIFTAGPSINGTSVPDKRSAWRTVTEQRAAGYDLLKIHPASPRGGVRRGGADGRARGHSLRRPHPGRRRPGAGAAVGHPHGRAPRRLRGGAPAGRRARCRSRRASSALRSWTRWTRRRSPPLAAATRAAGAWNTPTQVLLDNLFGGASLEEIAARPEMKYVPRRMREQWLTGGQGSSAGPTSIPLAARRFVELRRRLLRALRDAGAGHPARRGRAPGLQRARLRHAARAGVTGGRRASRPTRRSRRARAIPPSPWACPTRSERLRSGGEPTCCCSRRTPSPTSATCGSARASCSPDAGFPRRSWTQNLPNTPKPPRGLGRNPRNPRERGRNF